MGDVDTIAAISSPVGEGGIGIVRMSGPKAHAVLKEIFRPREPVTEYTSRHLYLGFLHHPGKTTDIDEVFAVFMDRPHTYTREDMAEVYCHGGWAAQRAVLLAMLDAGARMAEPGEFTRRAFLNGRIDLAQAESVLDLIESETSRELESALAHVKGELSERIAGIKADLRGLLVEVEAELDFPEEELSSDAEGWTLRVGGVQKAVEGLLASYYEGRAITEGLSVLILGRSNVGKSSLLNALTLSERAIVTPLAGTTRDLIEGTIHINGIKLKITDTAGLRMSEDPVEKEGVERARRRIPEADMILWVLDGSTPYSDEDEAVYEAVADKRTIGVVNKSDLPQRLELHPLTSRGLPLLALSARTGSGMDALRSAIYEACFGDAPTGPSGLVVTSMRHRNALQRTGEALCRVKTAAAAKAPLEIVAFELRDALSSLGEITGETCPEELLGEIFSRFCIGK
jgi:tRNA modification GTPase